MSELHPWIDPDEHGEGLAVLDEEGMMVPLDMDDPLLHQIILAHPEDCADDCPGMNL